MKNVEMKVDKKSQKLIIEVDLKKTFGRSKSKKNVIISSTEGNAAIADTDGAKIGLNIYRPATDSDPE